MVEHRCSLKDSICFHVYTLILARYIYSKDLSPKNKMWHFSAKQSIQFFEPGEYGLALSRILHSSDTSMFLFFWSHMNFCHFVTFCLFLYLKEFLYLHSFFETTLC